MTPPGSDRGLTSTELAVLMPVVIVIVLVPIQLGLWWHASQIAVAAAREAVDAAQVETASEADGVSAAERFLNAAGNIQDPSVTVTKTIGSVAVEVSGRAPQVIPGFDWQVTATAVAQLERFIPEPDR